MTAPRTENQQLTDRQVQARLERLLAAKRATEAARESRYRQLRTLRSEFRANAKAPMRAIGSIGPARAPQKHSGWRDLAGALAPLVIVAALGLLAHWAGWV